MNSKQKGPHSGSGVLLTAALLAYIGGMALVVLGHNIAGLSLLGAQGILLLITLLINIGNKPQVVTEKQPDVFDQIVASEEAEAAFFEAEKLRAYNEALGIQPAAEPIAYNAPEVAVCDEVEIADEADEVEPDDDNADVSPEVKVSVEDASTSVLGEKEDDPVAKTRVPVNGMLPHEGDEEEVETVDIIDIAKKAAAELKPVASKAGIHFQVVSGVDSVQVRPMPKE